MSSDRVSMVAKTRRQALASANAKPKRCMTADDAKFLVKHRPEALTAALDVLIDRIQKQVRFTASKSGGIDLFFPVPLCIPDCPLFDHQQMVVALRTHFKQNGFFAELFRERVLYLNWEDVSVAAPTKQ